VLPFPVQPDEARKQFTNLPDSSWPVPVDPCLILEQEAITAKLVNPLLYRVWDWDREGKSATAITLTLLLSFPSESRISLLSRSASPNAL